MPGIRPATHSQVVRCEPQSPPGLTLSRAPRITPSQRRGTDLGCEVLGEQLDTCLRRPVRHERAAAGPPAGRG